MTTKVTVDVNGRHKATVKVTYPSGRPVETSEVYGRFEGSPNPTGQKDFWLPHPATATFEVTEEYLGEPPAEAGR